MYVTIPYKTNNTLLTNTLGLLPTRLASSPVGAGVADEEGWGPSGSPAVGDTESTTNLHHKDAIAHFNECTPQRIRWRYQNVVGAAFMTPASPIDSLGEHRIVC